MRQKAAVIFNIVYGWAGAAVSDEGILRITLPVRGRKTVERELRRSGLTIPATLPLAGRVHDKEPAVLFKTIKLLRKFFAGEPVSFDLPLDLRYYTAFQRAVWKATASIPYGETRSYAWIAKQIGQPKAARAVGQALGANPVPILIP